jgi:hypothetical protein
MTHDSNAALTITTRRSCYETSGKWLRPSDLASAPIYIPTLQSHGIIVESNSSTFSRILAAYPLYLIISEALASTDDLGKSSAAENVRAGRQKCCAFFYIIPRPGRPAGALIDGVRSIGRE